MNSKKTFTWGVCLSVALLLLTVGAVRGDQNHSKLANPFLDGQMRINIGKSVPGSLDIIQGSKVVGDPVDMDAALVLGANYLRHAQADVTEDNAGNGDPDADLEDGGWDWRLTAPSFIHSSSSSPTNLYGVTAKGLYYAYLETADASYMTALQDAATQMIGDPNIRSAGDLIFLMLFQDLSGVTPGIYQDSAKAKFDGRIATYGSATALAEYIRNFRAGQGYENGIIPWDIGAWVVAAQMLEDRYPSDPYDYAQAADDMAEVIYKDSYEQNPGYFDLTTDKNNGWDLTYSNTDYYWYTLGITGILDAFEAANIHTDKISGLVTILLNCQYSGGAFSYCYGANTDDEDWQSTAYAVMTLARVDQSTYQTNINHACYWIGATQYPDSGGWVYSSGNHYPEVGGECTGALYYGENASEVWVDDDYCDTCYNNGHLWGYDAFDNIQDGIDAVSGSIVNVAAGTYAEYLIINKDNLTIQGAGIDVSIIDLDGLTPYWHYPGCSGSFASRAGVYFSGYGNPDEIVENCAFKGFTVKNAGLNPPITDTGTHTGPNDQLTTLTDNTKAWTPGALVGQWVHNYGDKDPSDWKPARSYGLITANTATTVTATLAGGVENDWDNGDPYLITPYEEFHNTLWIHYPNYDGLRGISIGNGKNILIQNCKVTDCGYGGVTTGKARCTSLQESEDLTIDNCICLDNPTTGISVGSHKGQLTITNNTCERNERPHYEDPTREYAGYGIHVSGRSSSKMASGLISGNTCSDNGFIGIILEKYVDGITIENNTVTGHNLDQDGAGIFFYHWSHPEYNKNHIIRNNTVTGNIRGIVAYYASYCTIEDNTITTDAGSFDKGQAGIKLDWANNITVKDNNLSSLDGKGINVSNSYDNIIGCSGNTIDGAMYSGILVRGSDSYGNTFTDNVITGSSFAGIFIRSGAYNNTFTDNTITATTVTTGKFLRAYGTHDGGDNASILSDGTQSWTVDGLKDLVVYNIDDGSSGIITANTATTVTATLSGGDNDWDFGDSYEIYYEESQGDGVLLFGYSDFVDDLSAGTGNVFHYNSIYGNADDGMENQVSAKMIVDAENNRWGCADGPEDLLGSEEATFTQCYDVSTMKNEVGEISGRLGNGVSENVDYCPWLGVSGFDVEIYAGCNDPCDNFRLDFKLSGTDVRFFHFEYPLPDCIDFVSSSASSVPGQETFLVTISGSDLYIDGSFDDPNFTGANVKIGEICFTHDGTCPDDVQTLTCTYDEVLDGGGNTVDVSPGLAIINLDNTAPTMTYPASPITPCYRAPDDPANWCWNLGFHKGTGEWQCDLLQATIQIYKASSCGGGDLVFTHDFFTTPISGDYNICYPTNQTDRNEIWAATHTAHGDGIYYVELTVWDNCCNVDSNCDAFTFCIDTETENYMTCVDARPAHNHICLEWDYTYDAVDAVQLRILRSPYRAANYPEYAASDPVPSGHDDADWYVVHDGTDTYPCTGATWYNDNGEDCDGSGTFFDNTTRDIYWYAGFTQDAAGNWSDPNMTLETGTDRATSYWLGDVTNDFGPANPPDGYVFGHVGDLHRLTSVYGTSPADDHEVDYGPETEDHGIGRGIPEPDNAINWLDLKPFSFNYNIVGPLDDCDNWPLLPGTNPPRQLNKSVDEIAAVWLKQVESTHPDGITFALMLTNPDDATHLFHSRISYNTNALSLIEVRRGKVGITEGFAEFFAAPIFEDGLVDVDLAALGPDAYLVGSGAVAYLDFSYKTAGMSSEIWLKEAILYDGEGNEINLSPTGVEVENQGEAIPTEFALHHNHPNPFNPTTIIKYDLPKAAYVKLVVYNVMGQKVTTLIDGMVEAGHHQVMWDAKDLSSGIYFYKITAGNFTNMRKMILLK